MLDKGMEQYKVLNTFIKNLKELFPELESYTVCPTKDRDHDEDCIRVYNDDIDFYCYLDDNNNVREVTFDKPVQCYKAHPNKVLDVTSGVYYFRDFDVCKHFVTTHSAFPKTVYDNSGIYLFSDPNNNLVKINDITKVKKQLKVVYVED